MTGAFLFVFMLAELGCLALGLVNYAKIRNKMYLAETRPRGMWGVYIYAYTAMRGSRETWLMSIGFGVVISVAIAFRVLPFLVAASR